MVGNPKTDIYSLICYTCLIKYVAYSLHVYDAWRIKISIDTINSRERKRGCFFFLKELKHRKYESKKERLWILQSIY